MHPFIKEAQANGVHSNEAYLTLLVNKMNEDYKPIRNSIYGELARLELDQRGMESGSFLEESFHESIKCIYDRIDCFDFVLPGFLFLMTKYGESDKITKHIKNEAKDMILGCKYWMDEGGDDKSPCYFTENHQMLYHCNEYIAGQLYKTEKFTNNGKTGLWHMEHARPFILRWLEWRFKFGFCEWLSNAYYQEDMLSISLLAAFSEDNEIKVKAKMIIDLLFFDMALNSYKGVFGSSHGRAYCKNITDTRDGSFVLRSLFLGIGEEELALSSAAVHLAIMGYEVPKPIYNCAQDQGTFENIQCMSMNVEEGAALGVDPLDYNNLTYFWGMGANNHKTVVNYTINTKANPGYYLIDRAKSMKEHYDLCDAAGIYTDPDGDYTSRPKADLYEYKTKDYMISCVQDHKKGTFGFQVHVWQASLGGRAVIFTNHPATQDYTGRPNKWAGNRIMPKVQQHKNVVISMYNTTVSKVPSYTYHTHAYIPQEFLDEVIEKNGWVFSRKDNAYAAVKAISGTTSWIDADPLYNGYMGLQKEDKNGKVIQVKPYEYSATGRSNVWICEMGSKDVNGSFELFMSNFDNVAISGDVFGMSYASPSLGNITTGWSQPFTVDGKNIRTDYQVRYDNPWSSVKRGALQINIDDAQSSHLLDFSSCTRKTTKNN